MALLIFHIDDRQFNAGISRLDELTRAVAALTTAINSLTEPSPSPEDIAGLTARLKSSADNLNAAISNVANNSVATPTQGETIP